jgi:hypothetical protein
LIAPGPPAGAANADPEQGVPVPAADETLAIDYIVHHLKANGSQTAKVFKLATRTIGPGESITLHRRHSFKLITTRAYYPGEHALELQVNGTPSGRTSFELTRA